MKTRSSLHIPFWVLAGIATVGLVGRSASSKSTPAAGPTTVHVKANQSIQDAIDSVDGNAVILVEPGVYHETLLVDFPGITLRGLEQNGKRPVLDGRGKLADGVVGSGDDFVMEGFRLINYQGNGVVYSGARNVTLRDLVVRNTGLYGVYPVTSTHVRVERCVVSENSDSGIYIGQSRDIIVRDCEAYGNVAGIEIENCEDALVANNSCHGNTAGILVFVLPNLPMKVGRNTRVVANRVHDNNHPNFGKTGSAVASLPPGVGISIMAADRTIITANELWGNDTMGIGVVSFTATFPGIKSEDIDPLPDENQIFDNEFRNNGTKPAKAITRFGLSGVDLFWDMTGKGNGWREQTKKRMPPFLPPIRPARLAKTDQRNQNKKDDAARDHAHHADTAKAPGNNGRNEPAGVVTGLIRYDGKVPASWLPKDNVQTAKHAVLTDQTNLDPTQLKPPRPIVITKDGGIRDVVVALESESAAAILKKKEFPPTLVDQIGGVFVPAVTVVPPGGKVLFHNADQINHNVHLISPNQKEYNFNIGHDQKRTIRLGDDPNDTIRVVCDLHAWMRASLVVVPTPYYCVSDRKGRFRIDGVPPGTYHLRLYHQRLAAIGKLPDVVVSAGQETAVEAKMVRSRRRR